MKVEKLDMKRIFELMELEKIRPITDEELESCSTLIDATPEMIEWATKACQEHEEREKSCKSILS